MLPFIWYFARSGDINIGTDSTSAKVQGILRALGANSSTWASVIDTSNERAGFLHFYSDTTYPSYFGGRLGGFSVR